MDLDTKQLAERMFDNVLIGRSIVGLYFRTSNIWFATVVEDGIRPDETFLQIENLWAVVNNIQNGPHTTIEYHEHTDWQLLSRIALELTLHKVTKVSVDTESSELSIEFSNGSNLLVQGSHEMYESWTISAGEMQVVSTPGNDLAIWAPDSY